MPSVDNDDNINLNVTNQQKTSRKRKEYNKFCDFELCNCGKVFENKYKKRDHINSIKEKMKKTAYQEKAEKKKNLEQQLNEQISYLVQSGQTTFDLSSVAILNNHSLEEIDDIITPALKKIVEDDINAQRPIIKPFIEDTKLYKDDVEMNEFYNKIKGQVLPFGISSSSVEGSTSAPSSPTHYSTSNSVSIELPNYEVSTTELVVSN